MAAEVTERADEAMEAPALASSDREGLGRDRDEVNVRAAILRAALRSVKQPRRTQLEQRLGRALRRQRHELRDAELAALELEIEAYGKARAER